MTERTFASGPLSELPVSSGTLEHQTIAQRGSGIALSSCAGVCRWFLVVVFLVSGVSKLVDIDAFGGTLATTGFFASGLVPVLKYCVPMLEIAAATSIALKRIEAVGLAIAAFLSAAFTGLHAYLHFNGIVVPCGCAGVAEVLSPKGNHLALAVYCAALFACSAFLMCLSPRRSS